MKKFTISSSTDALILLSDVVDSSQQADLKCQNIQCLKEDITEILHVKNAVKVMTYVLMTAVKIQTQADQFSFKRVNFENYYKHCCHEFVMRLMLD